MLTVKKLTLTRKKIATLNQAHRNWVLFLGHVANEMMFLLKLMLWTDPENDDVTDPHVISAAAQTMIIARLLMGKQWEAYNVLRESYFGSTLERVIQPHMSPNALEACRNIQQTFDHPESLYSLVRNRFAFHYSLNEFGKEFQSARKAEPLFVLFGEGRGSTLFGASEVIINRALLRSVDKDPSIAMSRVAHAAVDAARWFNDFCDGFINAALINAWGEPSTWGMEDVAVQASGGVKIPWFTTKMA